MLTNLILEVTNNCNLKCKQCGYWKLTDKDYISYKKFKEIVDLNIKLGLKSIMFTGGEPTLNNDIGKMITYSKAMGLYTKIATNGVMISKLLEEKVLDKIDEIVISLDASNSILYKEIRGADSFNKIIQNIEYIKRNENSPNLTLSFLVQRTNFRDLSNFVELSIELNADRISVLTPNRKGDFQRQLEISKYENSMFLNKIEIEEWKNIIIPKFKNIYSHNKIKFAFGEQTLYAIEHSFDTQSSINRTKICPLPFKSVYIDSQSNVKICPFLDMLADTTTSGESINDLLEIVKKQRETYVKDRAIFKENCLRCLELPID